MSKLDDFNSSDFFKKRHKRDMLIPKSCAMFGCQRGGELVEVSCHVKQGLGEKLYAIGNALVTLVVEYFVHLKTPKHSSGDNLWNVHLLHPLNPLELDILVDTYRHVIQKHVGKVAHKCRIDKVRR